ncbi:4-hydroxythreonine-4-phosphate dehydrogenase PdxA [Acidiferrobacter sp.]|uniref:4-hydroxythreonine-4-phosphate dehydrogenase PdxA n=1 Tax=Acidiferrobacter sp. TaxID=1872107 RepID=UPI0026054F23|nr:4-hydroxythreonine-4-phosphate dehydrogenase PdxA [Acidiferrobacter sp.]
MSVILAGPRRPVIAMTPGEPAGIGPDLMALVDFDDAVDWVCVADPDVLADRARLRGRHRSWPRYAPGVRGPSILPVAVARPVRPGVLNPANADYVLSCLTRAAQGCLTGEFTALVTGPVHKAVINEAGHAFTGHTEFLAREARVAEVVMMLVAGSLRVALVTTHVPLAAVPAMITGARLDATLDILHTGLMRDFGFARPAISVLGLNPHAGEDGHLGHEEIDVIAPSVRRAQARGIHAQGPIPADTAFIPARLAHADAVLAMYHDQGLPVLKAQGFGGSVNVTLGLPFPRVSVDHGTALDRAGTGPIDIGSMRAAMDLARALSCRHASP